MRPLVANRDYEMIITLRRRGQSEVSSLGVPDSGLMLYSVSTMWVIVLLLNNSLFLTVFYLSFLLLSSILTYFSRHSFPIKHYPGKDEALNGDLYDLDSNFNRDPTSDGDEVALLRQAVHALRIYNRSEKTANIGNIDNLRTDKGQEEKQAYTRSVNSFLSHEGYQF